MYDTSICIYIYILFVAFYLYGKNFAGTFFVPFQLKIRVHSTKIPAETRQFLSYKHAEKSLGTRLGCVPLCRDDIMLSLQIVP